MNQYRSFFRFLDLLTSSIYSRNTSISVLAALALLYSSLGFANSQSFYDFNTSDQLTTYFYNDGGSSVAWSSNTGIGDSGDVFVGNVTTNEVFVTKQGYVNGGEGSVYQFSTYIKSVYNNGYSGLGFTNDPAAIHDGGVGAAPATALGISVHGGGFIFHNDSTDSSGSWNSGGVVNATISDLLNNGSPDDWYKVNFIISKLSGNDYHLRVEIYPAYASGVLISTSPDSVHERTFTNATLSSAPVIYSYFAFGGRRVSDFDNYTINLDGATVIDPGEAAVTGSAVTNSTDLSIIDVSGEVLSDGGSAVTARGFVYDTVPNPDLTDQVLTDAAAGVGAFSGQLTGLNETIWYVRPYATNSVSTVYGPESIVPVGQALKVAYHFENNLDDVSGNDNHGTGQGTIAYDASGHTGSALDLSGSDYVAMPNDIILEESNFTISTWFKTTTSGAILGYQNTTVGTTPSDWLPMLAVNSTGHLAGNFWTDGGDVIFTSTSTVNDGNWHRATLVTDSAAGTVALYLDGSLVGSSTASLDHVDMTYNQVGVADGRLRTGLVQGWDYFTGQIDEFLVYARAQSSAEVAKQTQSITFATIPDRSVDQTPLSLTATASSGLAVSYSSSTPTVCTVSGTTATLLTTGVCSIKASQAGDATYSAAPNVTRSFNVTLADADGDGISDGVEGTGDTDHDGTPDYLDLDSDNDGIPDSVEGTIDNAWVTADRALIGAGNALNFNGDDVQAVANVGTLADANMTLEAWVKFNNLSGDGDGFSYFLGIHEANTNERIVLNQTNSNALNLFAFKDSVNTINHTTEYEVVTNHWYHIALSVTDLGDNTADYKLYVDGKEIAAINGASVHFDSGDDFNLWMGDWQNVSYDANVSLDEVRLWSVARSSEEIHDSMAKALAGTETGLLAYFPMDNIDGTTTPDLTVNTFNATITGAPAVISSDTFNTWRGYSTDWNDAANWTLGRRPYSQDNVGIYSTSNDPTIDVDTTYLAGDSLDFDGSLQYVEVPHHVDLNFSSAFTLEAWINVDSWPGTSSIMDIINKEGAGGSSGTGYMLRINEQRVEGLVSNGTQLYSASSPDNPIALNEWAHVALRYTGSELSLLIDGKVIQTTAVSGSLQHSTGPLHIGASDHDDDSVITRFFDGEVDEARIWNVARTDYDIRAAMDAGLIGTETGLVAYYKFDEGTGTASTDSSGNGHNGTLVNGPIRTVSSAYTGIVKTSMLTIGTAVTPTLGSSIGVEGNLLLESNVDLNANSVILGQSSTLIEGSGLFHGPAGSVVTTRLLDLLTADNVAGMGAELTANWNMGQTTLVRTHAPDSDPITINRRFEIVTTNTPVAGDTTVLTFRYDDSELNGLTESEIIMLASQDGLSWTVPAVTTLDTINNHTSITVAHSDTALLRYWSLGSNTHDSDGDGVTDQQELIDGTDPDDYYSILDTDGDGVPDTHETAPYSGGDHLVPDADDDDGDGVIDYVEAYPGQPDMPVILYGSGVAALDFAGGAADSRGSITDSGVLDFTTSNQISIAAWIYPNSLSGGIIYLNSENENPDGISSSLRISAAGEVKMEVGNGTDLASCRVAGFSGDWLHLVGTYDGTGAPSIYLNGDLLACDTSIEATISNLRSVTQQPSIGYFPAMGAYAGGQEFDGIIDELAIWQDVLTGDEIAAIYNNGDYLPSLTSNVPGYQSSENLVAYWQLEENSGSSINDSSSNDHSGTLINSPTWVNAGYNHLSVPEGTLQVNDFNAWDADGDDLVFSITGGLDQSLFSIDADSGLLTFNTEADYESPADSDANNSYDLQIAVTANGDLYTLPLTVIVTNEVEDDNDGDGILDVVDPDDDNDGLSDTDEINVYGTDPLLADTDGDGTNDGVEIALGGNPLNHPPIVTQGTLVTVIMSQDGTPTAWSAPALSATDNDSVTKNQTLTWSVFTAPANGSATVAGDSYGVADSSPTTFNYIPASGFTGTDYFTVQISDGLDTDNVTIRVDVNPVTAAESNSEFIPYTVGGAPVYDHEGSSDPTNGGASVQPDIIDIASCSSDGATPGNKPSVLIAYRDADKDYSTTNDAQLVMRIRLDADPSNTGNGAGLKQGHWDFLIDIDNNGSNDYVIDVDGNYSGNGVDRVWLYADRNSDNATDESELISEFEAAGGNARASDQANSAITITKDDSETCGGRSYDYWLDVSIPVDSFSEPGLPYNASVPIGAFYSSSASKTDPLQKDWMGQRNGRADTFSGEGGGRIQPEGGTIDCLVYDDVDGNGVFALPDMDLGHLVELLDQNGNVLYAGACQIDDVEPGNYQIRNIATGAYTTSTRSVTVVGGESTTVHLPVQQLNLVSVYVFEDLDGDGEYDPGEPDINGSDIHLNSVDSGSDIVSDGSMQIPLYVSGRHVIKHNAWIPGYVASSAIELAINHVPGSSHTVRFGLVRESEISGMVFVDRDGDGLMDSSETPLSGATLILKDESNTQIGAAVVTAADGNYRFTNDSHGVVASTQYFVEEINPTEYASTSADEVAVSLNTGSSAIVNFGDVQAGRISGFVFNDANGNNNKETSEQGLAWVTITILNNHSSPVVVNGTTYQPGDIVMSVQTDTDGYYIAELPPGRYRVVESDPQGYSSVSPNDVTITLPSSITVANFADMVGSALSGMVFNDVNANGLYDTGEPGLANVVMNLDGGPMATTTGSDGGFYLPGLADGSYSLNSIVPTGFVATTASSQSVTVSSTSVNSNLLFGMKVSGSIDGEVFHDFNSNGIRDAGEPGIGGVVITLGGSGNDTTTTLVNGNFSITELTADRSYTVTETDPANFISVNSNSVTVALDANGSADSMASFADLFEGTVSGTVFSDLNSNGIQDANETGVAGATLTLDSDTTLTDNQGNYQFLRISGDGHSLSLTVPDSYYLTTNNNPTVINMSTYSGSRDFGVNGLDIVRAIVFEDFNGDGLMNAGEPLLQGVSVSMDTGETATSDANGVALMTDLAIGANQVSVAAVSGYADTRATPLPLTLTGGGNIHTVYFGKYRNLTPWVNAGAVTIAEDHTVGTTVQDTIFSYVLHGDDNQDITTLTILSGNENGLFSITSDTGVITLAAAADFETNSSHTLALQIEDAGGLTSTADVIVTITDVNEAPAADAQTVAVTEDIASAVLLTGSDVDGDVLSFNVLSQPTNGVLSGTAPNLTYTPNANYFGADSFTFATNDGLLTSASAIVTLTVAAVNDSPIAVDDNATVDEDGSVPINVTGNDSDIDNALDLASIQITTQPAHGSASVDSDTGVITYTPAADYFGPDALVYRVADVAGLYSNTATVTIVVNSINDAPVANSDAIETQEDTASAPLDLLANDSDMDGHLVSTSVTVVTPPAHALSYSIVEGVLNYTPAANFSGSDTLTYLVKDNDGLASNTVTVSITVTAVNDAPVAVADTATTQEDSAVAIDVTSNDSDLEDSTVDATTVSVAQQPVNGNVSVDPETGKITYTPDPDFSGLDTFSYQVSDAGLVTPATAPAISNEATVTVTVTAVNDQPIAVNDTASTDEDTPVAIDVLSNDQDIDNSLDKTSVVVSTAPVTGTVEVDAVTGHITYTPGADFNGTDSFSYTVADSDGSISNSATVDITVNPVNDAPQVSDDNATTDEDTALVIDILANDTDSESGIDSTTVLITQQPVSGSVTVDPVTGEVTYTPDADFNGTDEFGYTVNDVDGLTSDVAVVTITTNPLNDAPIATDDFASVDEDGSLAVDILANDVDAENLLNPASVQLSVAPSNGTVSISPSTGAIYYEPDADFHGIDSLTYQVSDVDGLTDTAVVEITVVSVNDAPVALNDAASTDEDAQVVINVVANDTDVDSTPAIEPTSVQIVANPTYGSAAVNSDGTISYNPAVDFAGADEFTYQVQDADGKDSNIARVVVTVAQINDPPVASDDSGVTDEDSDVAIDVIANDLDNENGTVDPASVVVLNPPTHGSVSVDELTGVIRYTPAPDYHGSDSFQYQVKDLGFPESSEPPLLSNAATVSLTVNPVNDAPVSVDDNVTMLEDGESLAINVLANDQDIDGALDLTSVTALQQPFNGSIVVDTTTGMVTYTPAANFNGADTFSYTVSDDEQAVSNEAQVLISVTAFNDAPLAEGQQIESDEDVAVTITLTGSDIENDPLVYTVVSQPVNGSLTGVAPDLVYTPNPEFHGSDSFTFIVNDGESDSSEATVALSVSAVNDEPLADAQSVNATEDIATTVNLSGSDIDGDTLSFTIVSQPQSGSLTGMAPELTYTPLADYNGADSFSFIVNDGSVDSAIATVNIIVAPANDAPVADNGSVTTPEDTSLAIDLAGSDTDGDSLTYHIVTEPAHGELTGVAPDLVYTPNPEFHGSDSFTFIVNDGESDSSEATVALSVSAVNDEPLADAQSVNATEDIATTVNLSGSDIDGDTLSFTIVSQPQSGSLTGMAPELTYTPLADYNGADSFSFIVNDGSVDSAIATVTIIVAPANDAPVADNGSVTTPEDTPLAIDLTGSDTDGDSLTYHIVTEPAHGQLTGSGGHYDYLPHRDFNGTDVLEFVANDGQQDSAVAAISITVTAVNDHPIADEIQVTGVENQPLSITLSGIDPEDGGPGFGVANDPAHGTLTGNAPDLVYTPEADFTGTDVFTFLVIDSEGVSDSATVSITIEPDPTAPTVDPEPITTEVASALTINLADNHALSAGAEFALASQPFNGSVTIDPVTGVAVYTPDEGYAGADSFSYYVIDENGQSTEITIDVSVELPLGAATEALEAIDDQFIVAENRASDIDVMFNDVVGAGELPDLYIASQPLEGSVIVNGDQLRYTPPTDFVGTVSFSYMLSNNAGFSNRATVDIEVLPPPTVTLPADISVNATALYTKVDLGTAIAYDFQGQPVPVSVVDGITFFWPGVNTAVWQATDENGLTTYAEQKVNVLPLVSFSKDQTLAEGSQVVVKVILNGPSPVYPVNVDYIVKGSASSPDDHNLIEGTAVIGSGTETSIVFDTFDDAIVEGDETIVVRMSDPTLNQGVKNSHTIIISEENISPVVTLNPIQNGFERLTVGRQDGPVEITATVTDPNSSDTHGYDWSNSHASLLDQDGVDSTFTFDPVALSEGVYQISLEVTDSGSPPESNIAHVFIEVVEALPFLGDTDSDQDGIPDHMEGFADSDRDGIPDYLDSVAECNVLPEQGLGYDGYLLEADPGVCTRLGNYALLGESGGTQVTEEDIDRDPNDDFVPDPGIENIGGLFDFIATELPDGGQSVNIVIAQRKAIPENPLYRKLKDGVWSNFIEDDRNQLASTEGEPGFCPPPGSDDYEPGLTEGHWCVQLTIEDGGPNDADDQVNRMVADPGGVGVSVVKSFSTSGGGALGTLSVVLFAGLLMLRLRKLFWVMLLAFCVSATSVNAQSDSNTSLHQLTVRFEHDSDRIPPEYYSAIEEFAAAIKQVPDEGVLIEGHASIVGNHSYNQKLSERRAKQVARMLIDRFKIDSARIGTVGYGESRPLDPANNAQAHAINRRSTSRFRISSTPRFSISGDQLELGAALPSSEESLVNNVNEISSKQDSSAHDRWSDLHWYVWGDYGAVDGRSDVESLYQEMEQVGLDATISQLDNNRKGMQLGLGYSINDSWQLEAGLVDLGEVLFDINGVIEDESLVSEVQPNSAKGYSLSGVFRYNFDPFSLLLRAGAFHWEGEYVTTESVAASNTKLSGQDFHYGLGIGGFVLKNLETRVLWQRFEVDEEDNDFVSLGLLYHF